MRGIFGSALSSRPRSRTRHRECAGPDSFDLVKDRSRSRRLRATRARAVSVQSTPASDGVPGLQHRSCRASRSRFQLRSRGRPRHKPICRSHDPVIAARTSASSISHDAGAERADKLIGGLDELAAGRGNGAGGHDRLRIPAGSRTSNKIKRACIVLLPGLHRRTIDRVRRRNRSATPRGRASGPGAGRRRGHWRALDLCRCRRSKPARLQPMVPLRKATTLFGMPALISDCAPMMLRVRPAQLTITVVSGDGATSRARRTSSAPGTLVRARYRQRDGIRRKGGYRARRYPHVRGSAGRVRRRLCWACRWCARLYSPKALLGTFTPENSS